MTDSEYLYELANMYGNIQTVEMQEHATRLREIRLRFETLERQMAFHFKFMSFTEKYGSRFTLAEPIRKSVTSNHWSPIPHVEVKDGK